MGMNEPNVLDAPQINLENPAFDQKWRREYIAFLDLLPELLRTHRDKFVAIHGGAVVAEGDTFAEVALSAYERVGYIPMHIGRVSVVPRPPLRLPSPRLKRRAAQK
jgi:hypothetical protein